MDDSLDFGGLGLDGKIQFVDHIRATIAALHRTYLSVLAALDVEENWRPDGATSMGRWVAGRHALTAGTGEELIRVAHRLEELPAISAAYAGAELSWDQTRHLARYATPDTDDELARRGARMSVHALSLEARRHEPPPEPKRESRFLDLRPDATGFHLRGWLPSDDGERVMAAVTRIAEGFDKDPDTGHLAPIAQRRADALTELACRRLAADGDADLACVTVFYDADTHRIELSSGIQLSETTFQRLCCDARFEAIGRADGKLVAAAAPHRNIPRWMRRAAKRRDHGCRFPGCGHIRRTQLHHIVPVEQHGQTVLENTITLCAYHHHLLHEGHWTLNGTPNGPVVFIRPDGLRKLEERPPPLQPELVESVANALADRATRYTKHTDRAILQPQ